MKKLESRVGHQPQPADGSEQVQNGLIPLNEAAAKLGISVDAARKIVKRRDVTNEYREVPVGTAVLVQMYVSFEELKCRKENPRRPGPHPRLKLTDEIDVTD